MSEPRVLTAEEVEAFASSTTSDMTRQWIATVRAAWAERDELRNVLDTQFRANINIASEALAEESDSYHARRWAKAWKRAAKKRYSLSYVELVCLLTEQVKAAERERDALKVEIGVREKCEADDERYLFELVGERDALRRQVEAMRAVVEDVSRIAPRLNGYTGESAWSEAELEYIRDAALAVLDREKT